MQRYCHPVKALVVGDKTYRTAAPAAKAIAWFIVDGLTEKDRKALRGLTGDAFRAQYRLFNEKKERLTKKAARRALRVTREYFRSDK